VETDAESPSSLRTTRGIQHPDRTKPDQRKGSGREVDMAGPSWLRNTKQKSHPYYTRSKKDKHEATALPTHDEAAPSHRRSRETRIIPLPNSPSEHEGLSPLSPRAINAKIRKEIEAVHKTIQRFESEIKAEEKMISNGGCKPEEVKNRRSIIDGYRSRIKDSEQEISVAKQKELEADDMKRGMPTEQVKQIMAKFRDPAERARNLRLELAKLERRQLAYGQKDPEIARILRHSIAMFKRIIGEEESKAKERDPTSDIRGVEPAVKRENRHSQIFEREIDNKRERKASEDEGRDSS
jgi:ribosomal protein L29